MIKDVQIIIEINLSIIYWKHDLNWILNWILSNFDRSGRAEISASVWLPNDQRKSIQLIAGARVQSATSESSTIAREVLSYKFTDEILLLSFTSFVRRNFIKMSMWIIVILVVGSALLLQPIWEFTGYMDPPPLNHQRYWGPGKRTNYKEVTTITKFNISASTEVRDAVNYSFIAFFC